MVKSELISAITDNLAAYPYKEVEVHVNTILDALCDAIAGGGRIEIRGFGSFSLHHRPPRKAHNPKTGKPVMTKSKYAPHFKPGQALREQVNNNSGD